MFTPGELVEEIVSGRQGQVGEGGIVRGQVSQFVQFRDGKQPLVRDIEDPDEWRTVKGTGEDGPPGLQSKTWVV